MTTLLFSFALVVMSVALIALSMRIKHLSEEIGELKDTFEFHKRIHKYEQLVADQIIKKFRQQINELEESLNKEQ